MSWKELKLKIKYILDMEDCFRITKINSIISLLELYKKFYFKNKEVK